MNYVTDAYRSSLMYDQIVFRTLLEYIPKRCRQMFNHGISLDTLAEIVTAKARKTLAADKDGYDLEDGVEVKYARYKRYNNGQWKANIGNLNSKRGNKADLCVIISLNTVAGIELKFFEIPWKVWETKVKGNSLDFCFQTNKHKWYMDYELSEKEYGL